MQLLRHRTRTMRTTIEMALLSVLLLFPLTALSALEKLDDAAMAEVSGAGIALGFEDFRWLTKPTSYFEQVGSDPGSSTEFQRGDMRWYGINISGAGTGGSHWDETGSNGFGTGCDASSLGCPRGGTIDHFAPYDNPYLVRAYSPEGFAYDGTEINGTSGNSKTIYEFLAPTQQPDYTMSFWGEIEAGATRNSSVEPLATNQGDLLKSQTIIRGNAANSKFRLFQFTKPGDETFAIMYHSYLQGDFRFSVAQHDGAGSDGIGEPVRFDANEGLHFKNVEAFVPLGQLYYQALIIDQADPADPATATLPNGDPLPLGNFTLEIPRIPKNLTVLNHFYSFATELQGDAFSAPIDGIKRSQLDREAYGVDGVHAGYTTARAAMLLSRYSNEMGKEPWELTATDLASTNYQDFVDAAVGVGNSLTIPRSYYETHGYSRWGDWSPCRGVGCPAVPITQPAERNAYNHTGDGMFFRACTGCDPIPAFAYMLTAVDVRRNPGDDETHNCPGAESGTCDGHPLHYPYNFKPRGKYTTGDGRDRYYRGAVSCTASNTADYGCGYGGSFDISAPTENLTTPDPSTYYGVKTATGATPQVINTDVVNIGDSRVEGLQMNYMKFTSYGVGN